MTDVSIRRLVGLDVLTVDHVRRTIVETDGQAWTDEDGITTGQDAISRVLLGGQPMHVADAVRRLTPWVEA